MVFCGGMKYSVAVDKICVKKIFEVLVFLEGSQTLESHVMVVMCCPWLVPRLGWLTRPSSNSLGYLPFLPVFLPAFLLAF